MKLWIDRAGWSSTKARGRAARLDAGDVQSIAVIKFGALGDMLMTRPFLVTLRERFPGARLTLSTASHYQAGIPEDLVDRVHVCFGKDQRHRSLRETVANLKELGPHDLVFDLTANARSRWLTMLTRAQLKIGFLPGGRHWRTFVFFYDVAVPRSDYKFEAETFLDQLAVLGIEYAWPPRFD